MIDVLSKSARQPEAAASGRDLAVNGLVLGVAGMIWFGWAQAEPPAGWATPLVIGSVLAMLLAVIGVPLTRRHRHGPSAARDPRGRRTYGWVVGIETLTIAAGAAILAGTGLAAYLPAWILFVVGMHFLPLARLFRIRSLGVTGLLLVVISAVAAVAGRSGSAPPSTVAGGAGGLILVMSGALSLFRSWQQSPGADQRHAAA